MRILVTGASGFIGGRFAAHALTQGLQVVCTGRQQAAMQWLAERGAQCRASDLLDADFALQASAGCDAIVHCAGAVGTWGSYQHFYAANVRVTEHIIAAAQQRRISRLVHLSSPSIYFDGQHHRNVREDFRPPRFFDHYGATKYMADQKVFAAGHHKAH